MNALDLNSIIYEWSERCFQLYPADYFDALNAHKHISHQRGLDAAAERAYILQYRKRPAWGSNLENYVVDTFGVYHFTPNE